jgi:hypothetical protein
MNLQEDPPHPIVERPWEYQIIGLNYQIPLDETAPFLDLSLRKGSVVRRLRFLYPRELTIERGFPIHTGGLLSSDVSARQWDGIGVRVHDFEGTQGAVEFWAADVIELDFAGEDA